VIIKEEKTMAGIEDLKKYAVAVGAIDFVKAISTPACCGGHDNHCCSNWI